MLDDLVQTLETLQKRIREHRDYLGNYESRTRVALIDPMLSALGWDVSDPDAVQIEPRTVNGWADYALLGSNRRPVIFVEAKKLADQDSPIRQTVGYAVSENIENRTNVRYCASTNGDVWEVYDIIAQESVMRVSLARDDAAKCALQLLGLWRRSLQDGGFDTAIEPLVAVDPVSEPQPTVADAEPIQSGSTSSSFFVTPYQKSEIVRLSSEGMKVRDVALALGISTGSVRRYRAASEVGAGPIASATSSPPSSGWTPIATLSDVAGTQPLALRLPSGNELSAPSWAAVIRAIASWLYESGALKQGTMLLAMGNRYIVSVDGRHADGKPFKRSHKIADGMVMELNYSSSDLLILTKRLLEYCGQAPAQVYVALP